MSAVAASFREATGGGGTHWWLPQNGGQPNHGQRAHGSTHGRRGSCERKACADRTLSTRVDGILAAAQFDVLFFDRR